MTHEAYAVLAEAEALEPNAPPSTAVSDDEEDDDIRVEASLPSPPPTKQQQQQQLRVEASLPPDFDEEVKTALHTGVWRLATDAKGRKYYFNAKTKAVTWDLKKFIMHAHAETIRK